MIVLLIRNGRSDYMTCMQALLKHRKMKRGFKVHITTTASNGVTYQVVVDHPDRPKGAEPWDAGRKVVFDTGIYGRAEYYRDMWIAFFNYKVGSNEPDIMDYEC